MNPNRLARHLRTAGYPEVARRLGDAIVQAEGRFPLLRRARRGHQLAIRTAVDGTSQVRLQAVAIHCYPPLLVCTEDGPVRTRDEVPDRVPLVPTLVRLDPRALAELRDLPGSLAGHVRDAVAAYLRQRRLP